MHNKDCQLMGLTWLLAKNRTAYIHTVTAVLRAMMMSIDGSDPRSCTLSSDGMPLPVDSSEISNNSFSISHQAPIYVTIAVICLLSLLHPVPSAIFQTTAQLLQLSESVAVTQYDVLISAVFVLCNALKRCFVVRDFW